MSAKYSVPDNIKREEDLALQRFPQDAIGLIFFSLRLTVSIQIFPSIYLIPQSLFCLEVLFFQNTADRQIVVTLLKYTYFFLPATIIIASFDTLRKICIIIHILFQNSDDPQLINQSIKG